MKPRISMVEITQKLIGLKYELGSNDCFGLIIAYFNEIGFKYPKRWEGFRLTEYVDIYKRDEVIAKCIGVEYIASFTKEIKIQQSFVGDILVLGVEDSPPFMAIDGGNGNVVAATEEYGIGVLSKGNYQIRRAFRCQDCRS